VIEGSTSLHLARDCSGRSAKMQKEIHLLADSKLNFDGKQARRQAIGSGPQASRLAPASKKSSLTCRLCRLACRVLLADDLPAASAACSR